MIDNELLDSKNNFRQYGYRIPIVIIFSTLAFVNGMCWVTVSPISIPVGRAYNQPDAVVAIVPMCFMILYVFVNFPSNWVLDVRGIKKGVVVGAILTSVGAAIRCLTSTSFGFLVVGQIVCAIAQPFILNAPTKIAIKWFLPKTRSVALAVLSVANIIGTAFGFLLPPMFVQDNAAPSKIRSQFQVLLLFQFIASLLPLTLVLFWFVESPPTPTGLISQPEGNYVQGVKKLFKDKRFLSLCFAFGTIMGSFCIYGSLMDNIFDCYGYSTDQVSYLAAAMMITGILSAGLFGAYIQKTLKYRRIFLILAILGIIQCVALPMMLSIVGYDFTLAFLLCALMGVVFIPLMPLSFDYGCDILYPAGQAQITGCLMTAGNFIGIIFIIIAQQMLGLGKPQNNDATNQKAALYTVVVVGAVTICGVSLYLFFNSQLKRSNLQKKKRQQSLLSQK